MELGLLVNFFNFEYADNINIRTAKNRGAIRLAWYSTAITQNVYVRKCNMQCHRTKLAAFSVKVECISYTVSMVTSTWSFVID